ncbi:hypothetical protein DSM106972_018320 [Dulcicalothrix desertica PCC 7102]|uniref:Uncharacterized protein n=1 Tax=Dulcicalothrix desertica PCC 7102 TaxID=232991 RepID=A0A433VNG0_9CYAN|nr:hypothetical protein [Dulcicalothrix desertica]RUT07572.1 hypothetical protein DSM106972_018320 [Dulcicalothrix desertica PCC 7102]
MPIILYINYKHYGLDFVEDLTFGSDGNLYLSSSISTQQSRNKVARYNGKTGAKIDDFVVPGSGGIFGLIRIDFGVARSA